MRFGTVLHRDRALPVAVDGAGALHSLAEGGGLAAALAGEATLDGPVLREDEVRWLPPVPEPRRILCAGYNFKTHAAEVDRDVPEHPTFFVRFPSTCVGHREPIVRPPVSDTLDWEGEVGIVIGRGGRFIDSADALDHVAGYTAFGDNSVREFQLHSTQATAGKNFDASGSFGPWIVTRDEVPDPAALEVLTFLNGEQMQHGRLADLVFSVADLIAYASTFTALEPGDVIAAGTPAGIGMRRDPPRYLQPGDELVIEIPGVMRLENRVVDQPNGKGSWVTK